ncbi:MAG: hypothetical protein HPY61_05085 [Methanotrichaceae archaeon]|nr:hypothetical protein [Methanotrichaceae archaeon]
MNQKTFAIFVGAIMVLSVFSGMMMRGGDQNEKPAVVTSDSVDAFGVQGRLVDWNFGSLADVLEMSPESTVVAYWLNISASQNLTDAAREVLPQSFALSYGNSLYPTAIQRLGAAYFNNTRAEFHWIRPFQLGYDGIVVPYDDYMMIPTGSDYMAVMGKPTIFGTEGALQGVLDVISGSNFPSDKFTLPQDEVADLEVAALGSASGMANAADGGYRELYLSVRETGDGDVISAKYLSPDAATLSRISQTASQYGLGESKEGDVTVISGGVSPDQLATVLQGLLPGLAQPF